MTWLDALAAIPWHQWVVLLIGVPAIGMTQFRATERWACFPGLCGQAGWFGGLDPDQPAFVAASVLCALIWTYSLWRHWLSAIWSDFSYLDSATTPTVAASIPRRRSTGAGRRPKLTRVK